MNASEAAQLYLQGRTLNPVKRFGKGRAPGNIALIKYWGKRDPVLNLPMNNSLSLSMGKKGALTCVTLNSQQNHDDIYLNGKKVPSSDDFARKIINYLNVIAPQRPFLIVKTWSNIPIAAGLASSAAGFAALIRAIDNFCGWQLPDQRLSLLARLGSGSAARSLWSGFVEWHQGLVPDGQDSFAQPLSYSMPDLKLGLWILDNTTKSISSRVGMLHTLQSSPLYKAWPETATQDLVLLKQALHVQDFTKLGTIAEANSFAMHATMTAARPALIYSKPATLEAIHQIWQWRSQGLDIYITQDAGPNLKLLFQKKNADKIMELIPDLQIII